MLYTAMKRTYLFGMKDRLGVIQPLNAEPVSLNMGSDGFAPGIFLDRGFQEAVEKVPICHHAATSRSPISSLIGCRTDLWPKFCVSNLQTNHRRIRETSCILVKRMSIFVVSLTLTPDEKRVTLGFPCMKRGRRVSVDIELNEQPRIVARNVVLIRQK